MNSDEHPNLQYFIYKTIILNNLYGVDIMHEAVEIAKLRLFLKMVGAVDINVRKPNYGLEPLPDIDFNIRTGNTLVGFATEQDFKNAVEKKEPLMAIEIIPKFEDEFKITSTAFKHFQNSQLITDKGKETHIKAKAEMQERLSELNEKLNEYLASTYGLDKDSQKKKYKEWLESHQPFHWFAEFYEIINGNGGFDVVIGNPPYVNTNNVSYKVNSVFKTSQCGDLFGIVVERASSINSKGVIGLIIPLSATSSDSMEPVKQIIFSRNSCWNSYFSASDQPSSLFTGVRHRLMITIIKTTLIKSYYSSKFIKWFSDEREFLFKSKINYYKYGNFKFPENCKISNTIEANLLDVIYERKQIEFYCSINSKDIVYYHNAPVHWGKVFNFIPVYKIDNKKTISSHLKEIFCRNQKYANSLICFLNSTLFYWYNWQYTNCRDLSKNNILKSHFDFDELDKTKVINLCNRLMKDYNKYSKIYTRQTKDGAVTKFDSFYPYKSKEIIDEIDTHLLKVLKLNQLSLDYLTNYDLKYRFGKALFGEEDGDEDEEE